MSRLPIRLRLTLAFTVTLALLVAALATLVYQRHRADLDAAGNQGLTARAAELQDRSLAPGGLAAIRSAEPDETLAAILDSRGAVVDATPNVERLALSRAVDVAAVRGVASRNATLPGFDSPVRLVASPLGGGRVGVVGLALADRDEALGSLRRELLLASPIALLCAGLISYGFAAAALRPVEAMRRRAAEISARAADERLPVSPARDELSRLGATLNAMIERLQDAAARERRVAADASHELRTPLALLRTELELALDGDRSRAELVGAVRSALEETERLICLTDDLLLLARADDDQLALRPRPVEAAGLLRRVADRFAPGAAAAGRRIETHSPTGLVLVADPAAVERALANLVANAVQHGAGTVTIRAEAAPPQLRVQDEGGVEEPVADLLDRFRRGRGAAPGGSGLGLAIVAAVAGAHGGEAGGSSQPGRFEAWISLGSMEPGLPEDPEPAALPAPPGAAYRTGP